MFVGEKVEAVATITDIQKRVVTLEVACSVPESEKVSHQYACPNLNVCDLEQ